MVAVSGGVDSVALLNMLSMLDRVKLVVAHYDHGIREESVQDADFVKKLAAQYGLPFELGKGNLGPDASEANARTRRYEFLESVRIKHNAQAIITAHHQDDLVETAIINLLRGTKQKGLTAILDNPLVLRPLISITKAQILSYAKSHNLEWVEDASNEDERYLRNHVRSKLAGMGDEQKNSLTQIIKSSAGPNKEIDLLLGEIFPSIVDQDVMDRRTFISLPHGVSREVLAYWLRSKHVELTDKKLHSLTQRAKTAKTGTLHDLDKRYVMQVNKDQIRITSRSGV